MIRESGTLNLSIRQALMATTRELSSVVQSVMVDESAARAEHALREFAEVLSDCIEQELDSQDGYRQCFDSLPFWALNRRNNMLYPVVHSFGVVEKLQKYRKEALNIVEQMGEEASDRSSMRVAVLIGNCFDTGALPASSRHHLVDAIQHLALCA